MSVRVNFHTLQAHLETPQRGVRESSSGRWRWSISMTSKHRLLLLRWCDKRNRTRRQSSGPRLRCTEVVKRNKTPVVPTAAAWNSNSLVGSIKKSAVRHLLNGPQPDARRLFFYFYVGDSHKSINKDIPDNKITHIWRANKTSWQGKVPVPSSPHVHWITI